MIADLIVLLVIWYFVYKARYKLDKIEITIVV